MKLKIKKGVPLIDQHDRNFMYGGKFGGNFIPETLKKPIDDLTKLFAKLRKDKDSYIYAFHIESIVELLNNTKLNPYNRYFDSASHCLFFC